MDVNALHSCFASTLDSNVNNRRQAELQLREAEKQPGFINACLEIVLEPQVSAGVQHAAAIYLKNKVIRYWDPIDDSSPLKIDNDEKPVFRERVIPALTKVSPQIRPIVVAILNGVVARDYPHKWPQFLDITLNLFQTNDIEGIRTGLTCLLEITRHFRWTSGEQRQGLNGVIDTAFPGLLTISNSLINETSYSAAEMLRDSIKCYKMASYRELPEGLRRMEVTVGWASLFIQVIKKDLPNEVMTLDEDSRQIHPWVKCKKWALANLLRLFTNYSGEKVSSATEQYKEFGQMFVHNLVPEILKVIFEQIQLWVEKKIWIANSCLFNMLGFLEKSVHEKTSWLLVKPHVETLISHVIFPLLCPTDEDLELFEDDAEEYIHKHINILDDFNTPDMAAANFLTVLIRIRRKATFTILLQFVQGVVNRHLENPTDLTMCRQKEGALRMMGSVSYIVLSKKSPIVDKMETFLAQYVFPDFASPHGFLRARACEFLNSYSEIKFTNLQNLSFAYQSVLKCMTDEHLPVQIEAVLALQPLIQLEDVQAAIAPKIPEIMQHLLKLGDKHDNDAISGVMKDFVEIFADQLTPFSLQLAEQMKEQFLRVANELIEKQKVPVDEIDYNDFTMEDKAMVGSGILNTMSSLLLALDNANEIVLKLEEVLRPVFVIILDSELSEFFTEVFALIESCTFCLKSISPLMWDTFVRIHKVCAGFGLDYLDEMMPCLENYIQYGAEQLAANTNLLDLMFDIIQQVMLETERLGANDRLNAATLSQRLLLSCKGHIDQYVPRILQLAVDRLRTDHKQFKGNNPYHVILLEVVIAGLYYNAHATLSFLESQNFTAGFFTTWFNQMNHFTRVYDKSVSALSILSIVTLPSESIPQAIQGNLPQLAVGLVTIMGGLPESIKHREELAKEFDSDDYYDYDDDELDNEWNGEEDEDNDNDKENDAANEYIEFLSKEAAKLSSQNIEELEDELEEEPLMESAIDNINVFVAFRDSLQSISQSDPTKYQHITSAFSENESQTVEKVITIANTPSPPPQQQQLEQQ